MIVECYVSLLWGNESSMKTNLSLYVYFNKEVRNKIKQKNNIRINLKSKAIYYKDEDSSQ